MNAKHTPAPWHLGGNKAHAAVVYAKDGWGVASCTRVPSRSLEEEAANALLISEAPNLLHTLELALREMEVKNIGVNGTRALVQLAIEKATGMKVDAEAVDYSQPTRAEVLSFLVEHCHYEREDIEDLPYDDLIDGLNLEEVKRNT